MAGQKKLRIYLSLSQMQAYGVYIVLGIQTWVLIYTQQAVLLLSHLSRPPFCLKMFLSILFPLLRVEFQVPLQTSYGTWKNVY